MDEMDSMVKMLAGAPEEQRRQMITQRMEMFASMPEENRVQAMVGMVQAINRLKPEEQKAVIKTRTAVVAGFPADRRKALLASRMKAGMQIPKEVHEADTALIQASLKELPEGARQAFVQTQQELMKAMGGAPPSAGPAGAGKATGHEGHAHGGAPTHHDRPMELKGILSKKYVCSVCGHTQPA